MKRLMKKKVNIFGKKISVFVIALFAVAIVSAALLSYFGVITGLVVAQQSILLDGKGFPDSENIIHEIPEPAPGGEKFCWKHILKNQMSVPGEVMLETTGIPDLEGITVTYDSVVTDTTAHPITDFGDRNNEVCGKVYKSHTLDEIFSGGGLQYGYTVINGGIYDGASPIVAIIDLEDGRHIALYPGWGTRSDDTSHSLQFSGTIATATADSGNVPVDFALYPSDFSSWLYGSVSCSYGNFEAIKADTSLLDGNEVVLSVSFQHQAADTGETDRLDWMDIEFGNEHNEFFQIIEEEPFVIEPDKEASFCLCYDFDMLIKPDTYTITTKVVPAA